QAFSAVNVCFVFTSIQALVKLSDAAIVEPCPFLRLHGLKRQFQIGRFCGRIVGHRSVLLVWRAQCSATGTDCQIGLVRTASAADAFWGATLDEGATSCINATC